jgi:pimeloyl-ACP methyl ester carboxylesterase
MGDLPGEQQVAAGIDGRVVRRPRNLTQPQRERERQDRDDEEPSQPRRAPRAPDTATRGYGSTAEHLDTRHEPYVTVSAMSQPRTPRPQVTPFHRGGAGDPLVLIHGFTSTWSVWEPILPALEAHHDVLAPSLVGHHGGEQLEPGARVADALYADVLERQLDELGISRAHLVGNSLGGWLALLLAARGRALSAVAICPGGGWYPRSRDDRRIIAYFRRNALAMRSGDWWIDPIAARPRLRRLALRDIVAHPERVSATAARGMLEGAARCQVLHETIAETRRESIFGELGPIDVPVRILYGAEDRLIRWPSCYERMRALLPDAEYVRLDAMGHVPMFDDPERLAQLVLQVTAAEPAAVAQSSA